MRILFYSHYYFPEGNAPATRVSALAERWVAAGNEVTVITCAPNVPNGVVYDGYRNRRTIGTIKGVRVVRVRTYIAANKGAIRRMLNFVSYFFSALVAGLGEKRPDVIIATSPQIFCGYVGVWHKLFARKVPLVVEIRDIWPESMEAVGARIPRLAYWLLERIEHSMYRSCDHLVTVGEGYRARLLEKGVPDSKMSIIMNGTDLATFSPRPKKMDLLEKYGLADKFVVSYIGTVGMACGLDTLLDAADQLAKRDGGQPAVAKDGRRIVFVVVGDGAERERLESDVKSRGLDNVIFTGRQPKSTMPEWVSSSDVNLVHLKKTDLFTTVMPSKIFESAGCARPIIMGVDGYAKKLVMDAEAGLDMVPESADSLVKCTLELAGDPDLCERLGTNAFRNIARVHNRDSQASEYLKILNDLQK